MFTKKMKKATAFICAAFVGAAGLTGCSNTSSSSDGETIKIGFVNWAECVAVSNIWENILEEQGYEVELTQLDVAPLFVGMSQGSVDIFLDAWLPTTHSNYWEQYEGDLYDAGVWYEESAKLGIVVPSYVTIDSLEDFNGVADQFDNEIIGIEPGAGMMKTTAQVLEDYGMDDTTLVQGSEAAMLAALSKAYEKNEWIAVTGWSPHWMFASYDLKYLEDPKGNFGSAEQLHTLLNDDFAQANPEVTAMLERFSMGDQEIGSVEKLINDGMDPSDAAKQWIEDNQDLVDSWIGE
ncbi:MAG: glycine betaine ABC transporter substrate-binding protein [Erysipelotrichaceae bacterium]|nr:glycine betaine ABC transporter substrate-binding protein [Erysipelotrichaceae bacterium]MDD3810178.1 glycine betaine ABC transporter substrate-binding protein [Erysipelotrichaceae bacterium]